MNNDVVQGDGRVALEVSPLKVGDRLYLCAGNSDVVALDAESGKQIWRFETKANPAGIFAGVCRGVAYYRALDGGGSCPERIVSVTLERHLLALNARDGRRCPEFGDDGEVNLDAGMGDVEPGYYLVTSAPQIVRGKVASGHGNVGGPVAQSGTPYAARIAPFLSPLVVPCTEPPYGMISAVDLNTRRLLWSRPFGTAEDSGPLLTHSHLPITMGVPNIGGAVITRSGLTFIGASQDNYLRAFETATGRELWRTRLPAGGQATPITYWSSSSARQFILIAAGGHGGLQTTPGDYILAYALPKH